MDFSPEDDVFLPLSPELQLPSQLLSQGTKRTRAEMRQTQDQSSSAGSKRTNQTQGRNWNEEDSLLLIEAVAWAEGQKKRICTYLEIF